MDCQQIQTQINQLTNRIQALEQENVQIKKCSQTKLFFQNFLLIDQKYQKLFRKYMKCLYKYGVYQSTLNNVINQYNSLVDDWITVQPNKEIEKISLQTCLANFGVVYENNKAIGEIQMENIINQRAKKEALDNKKLFLQGIELKIDDLLSDDVIGTELLQQKQPRMSKTVKRLAESIPSQQTISNATETIPSYPSEPKQETVKELQKDQDQIQIELQITEQSEQQVQKCELQQSVGSQIETQRYLKKLLTKNNSNYQQFLNDEIIQKKDPRILTERINYQNTTKPSSRSSQQQFTESLNFFTFDQGTDKENYNFSKKNSGKSGFRQILGSNYSGCDLQIIENSQKKQNSFMQINTSISSIRNKESQSPTNLTTQQDVSFLRQSSNCPKVPVVKSNGGKLTSLSDLLRSEEIDLASKNSRRSRAERLKYQ